jgi:ABC-2 type transport system permease protein
VWSVLWIVLPRALPVATTALYPVPARATFDAEVEARVMELGDTHNPDDPVFARFREETLRRHGVTRVEDLPINYNGLLMSKGEEVSTAAYREHLGALLNVYKQQARLIELAGAISPYLAVRLTSSALAGSDLAHQIEFERQAEDYRFRLVQALNELHAHRVTVKQDRYGGIVNGAPSRHRIDATFFDRLPTFVFVRPTIAWALREQAIGFLAGALGSVAIFAALAWTASRMRSLQA